MSQKAKCILKYLQKGFWMELKYYETNPSFSTSHATVVRGTDTHRQGAAFHNQSIFNICEIPSQIFYSFFSGPNLLSTYLKYVLIAFNRIYVISRCYEYWCPNSRNNNLYKNLMFKVWYLNTPMYRTNTNIASESYFPRLPHLTVSSWSPRWELPITPIISDIPYGGIFQIRK